MKPKQKYFPYIIALAVLMVVVFSAVFNLDKFMKETGTPKPTESPRSSESQTPVNSFDKNRFSIDDPASLWIVVNKKRPLPNTYIPNDLAGINSQQMRNEAATAANTLIQTAKSQGVTFTVISGYRSYDGQASVYNAYVKKDGQKKADTYSARPGHSEHQTGWAADIGNGVCDLQSCFGDTPAGKWLAAHAHEYGFVFTYKQGQEHLSGYQYEPWHIRYVGTELAMELYKNGQTMEQFFGLPAALAY